MTSSDADALIALHMDGERSTGRSAFATAARARPLSKHAVVAIVWLWLAVVTCTHLGARSPYSYGWGLFDEPAVRISGAVVNPDAIPIAMATRFFYDASPVRWEWYGAQNLRLPLHSFASATIIAFTRSQLIGSLVTNLLFAGLLLLVAVNLAERFEIDRRATLVCLMTVVTFPLFVEYMGQPLHYIVGFTASFLVVLSLLMLPEADLTGVAGGVALAILALNYDPYIYLAAVVCWLVFIRRFPSTRRALIVIAAAALPVAAWSLYLRVASDGTMTTHLRRWFIAPLLSGWLDFFMDPVGRILVPFVASHIGVHVGVHQLISMIPWPLAATCIWLLIRFRPGLRDRRLALLALLPMFFFVEQMVAAAWDWELNPRRAIPAVLSFAVAWLWTAGKVWSERRWRLVFVALLLLSSALALADTLLSNPTITWLHTGQAIRQKPQDAMDVVDRKLDEFPAVMHDETIVWNDMPSARIAASRVGAFAAGQSVGLFLLIGVLWLVARAQLLPRAAPLIAAGVWLLSAIVRFL